MFPTRSTYNKKGKKNMAKKMGEKTYNTRDSRDQLYVG